MCKISVVMLVYNAEMFLKEAIESVLKQSFGDFEFIIIDDGSTDETCSIVQTFNDKRIRLIQNKHDFIGSLNLGMDTASGKYIAHMDADDIMHIDRLKIQYTIMEEETSITVCGTWMTRFSGNLLSKDIEKKLSGLIEKPLLKFIQGNFIFHPTVMLRTEFLRKYNLKYENYPYAEDFKFWIEITKVGGQFYIDNQPLLYHRILDSQIRKQKNEEQKETTELIIKEVLHYLITLNKSEYPELPIIFTELNKLQEKELMTKQDVSVFFQNIFTKNERKLNIL